MATGAWSDAIPFVVGLCALAITGRHEVRQCELSPVRLAVTVRALDPFPTVAHILRYPNRRVGLGVEQDGISYYRQSCACLVRVLPFPNDFTLKVIKPEHFIEQGLHVVDYVPI
jgi:hypothetical protein